MRMHRIQLYLRRYVRWWRAGEGWGGPSAVIDTIRSRTSILDECTVAAQIKLVKSVLGCVKHVLGVGSEYVGWQVARQSNERDALSAHATWDDIDVETVCNVVIQRVALHQCWVDAVAAACSIVLHVSVSCDQVP